MRNVHLTPQLIQAVRDAVDIVAVAGEHTRLVPRGRRHVGLCPLHKEKTPSFSVDPVQGLFYCFGCGAGGDAIKLHMLLTGDDFPDAIEALARQYGIPLPAAPEGRGRGREREGPRLERALEAAAELFRRQLARSEVPRAYLARRRIPEELVERFGLGYALDGWRGLVEALSPRVPMDELVAAGLVGRRERDGRPYDRFRHRLVFPIHDAAGRLVGFGGRTLGDDRAKYINTSETERFHKGRLLYGLHLAKRSMRETGAALLVEGYFDVLAAAASGVEWAVAGMGTALTPEQARLLARYADEVVLGYDGDEAGETAAQRSLPLLLKEGLAVRRARFGEGEDPDSLRLAAGEDAVVAAVDDAEDAVVKEIERLIPAGASRQPHAQARAASAIGELLAPIPDPIVRFGYGRLAADRLGVPAEMLWRRTGGEGRPSPSAPAEPPRKEAAAGPRIVRSLEEQVLELLLAGGDDLPPPDKLPPEQAFFDPTCRNIFRTFCALYSGKGPGPPKARTVLASLAADGGAVDRLAQVLLESPTAPSKAALPALLDELERRWWRQRLRELAREIGEAQRAGEAERLDRLVREKTELSARLHRTAPSGPDDGSA